MSSSKKTILILILAATLTGCAAGTAGCPGEVCRSDHQEIEANAGFNGGTTTFSIPIELPDSPGLDPGISVSYSSRGGNGEMGEGWSNGATSSIFRCPATRAMDDYSSGVRYGQEDRLCLDGQHLIVTRGAYGLSQTTYTTEVEHHVSVEEIGDLNAPKTHFIAYYENGLRITYDTPLTPAGAPAPLQWYATRMENRGHEVVSYHYITPAPGEMLISEIRYGGRDEDGEIHEGNRVIRYSYEARPDIYTNYIAGGATSQTRRLTEIKTGIESPSHEKDLTHVRQYEFDYASSETTGRSLLISVTECRQENGATLRCHTPTRIDWAQRALHFGEPYRYGTRDPSQDEDAVFTPDTTATPVPPYSRGYDYDGDGRVELLETKPKRATHLYFLGLGGALTHDVDLGSAFTQDGTRWDHAQGDFVNMGTGELAGESGGKTVIRHWDGAALTTPEPIDVPYAEVRLAANFKGAGETDLLQIEPDPKGGAAVRYYENESSVPGHPRFATPVTMLRLPAAEGYQLEQRGTDLLGNGCADALVMRDGRIVDIILASDTLNGVRFKVVKPVDFGIPDALQDLPLYFLDINDDGLPDVVYVAKTGGDQATWHYLMNTGDGFAAAVDTGTPDSRSDGPAMTGTITGDLANDGTDELLYPSVKLVDYCLTLSEAGQDKPWCSGERLTGRYAAYDLGIYRYAVLRFVADPEGHYRPVLLPDTNIVAQANLATVTDIRGDGLSSVLSPFDPWFRNGAFRQPDGKLARCPPTYGCGLHLSINSSGARADQQDAAPDMALKIDRGEGDWVSWHYYPISNPVRAAYSVPPPDSPARYLGPSDFYFTSSMYVAADQTEHDKDGTGSHARFEFGGAQYNGDGRGFEGFQWVIYHDLDRGLRQVDAYLERFPWTGSNLSSWVEPESAQGDDYLNGKPGPDYIEYVRHTYDCLGPGRPQTRQAACKASSDGSYLVRERSSEEVRQDPVSHEVTSTQRHFYVYDCTGRRHEVDPDSVDGALYSCGSR